MTINFMKRFNNTKSKYDKSINNYIKEVNKSKNEAEIINKTLKDEVKKINLLKYTGVRTCINKYIRNMKALKIKFDKDISVKEEYAEILEIKDIRKEDFDKYIDFDKKNNIQKLKSIIFEFDEIDDKINNLNKLNERIVIRNQIMILEKCDLLEQLELKREYIKELLEKISEVEIEFYKSKDDIIYAMMGSCQSGISKEIKLLDNYRNLINKFIKEI